MANIIGDPHNANNLNLRVPTAGRPPLPPPPRERMGMGTR